MSSEKEIARLAMVGQHKGRYAPHKSILQSMALMTFLSIIEWRF